MLTPVDIQQKKFRIGIGYDKKDVLNFFREVSQSYEELYRSNAELKDKVITINDELQHYKATEENLQKSLMLAEKNSQQSKTNAAREAKAIELEAKNRANEIVSQAYVELEELEKKMTELESRYAEYKSGFYAIIKKQMEIIQIEDFDPDALIDPTYAQMLQAGMPHAAASGRQDVQFDFTDDPQMREHSSLGGGETIMPKELAQSSTLSVYGSKLGGEDGVDPFKIKESKPEEKKPKSKPKPSNLRMANEKEKIRPARFSKASDEEPEKDAAQGNVEAAKSSGKVMLGDGDNEDATFEFIEE